MKLLLAVRQSPVRRRLAQTRRGEPRELLFQLPPRPCQRIRLQLDLISHESGRVRIDKPSRRDWIAVLDREVEDVRRRAWRDARLPQQARFCPVRDTALLYREPGYGSTARNEGLRCGIPGRVLRERRILSSGDRSGDVKAAEDYVRSRLIDLLLPEREPDCEGGDENRSSDDVPLPSSDNPEIIR